MVVSIRSFVMISMALIFVFGVATGLTFWYSNHYANHATDLLVDSVESLVVAQDLQMNLSVHRRQSLLREFRSIEERKLKIQESDRRIYEDLAKIPKFSSSAQEDQIVLQVQQSIRNYLQAYQSLRGQGFLGDSLFLKLKEQYDQSQESIQNLIDINLKQTQDIETEAQAQNRLDTALMTGALSLLFALIALFTYGFRKLLYRPILKLKEMIDDFELGSGQAPQKVPGASEIQDISESFQNLSERLTHQKDLQLTFLSSIAHDLKNPLGAIKMSAEILSEGDKLAEEDRQVLSIISRQSDHLKRLVNDLLDTTRIESGHMEFKMTIIDIRNILQDCVLLHSNLSNLHSLTFEKPPDPVLIWADEQRITQVINNLLSNAIKYSPAGGSIKVQINLENDFVAISITDPGVGIPAEDLQGIFEPFRRSPATQKSIPGVGLGLAVSQKIIKAHPGGSISVLSEPGKGSTFTIHLALHKEGSRHPRNAPLENSQLF